MRERMLMLTAIAAILFANAFASKTQAAISIGTPRMHAVVENFTPVEKATCYGFWSWCHAGWHRICRP